MAHIVTLTFEHPSEGCLFHEVCGAAAVLYPLGQVWLIETISWGQQWKIGRAMYANIVNPQSSALSAARLTS